MRFVSLILFVIQCKFSILFSINFIVQTICILLWVVNQLFSSFMLLNKRHCCILKLAGWIFFKNSWNFSLTEVATRFLLHNNCFFAVIWLNINHKPWRIFCWSMMSEIRSFKVKLLQDVVECFRHPLHQQVQILKIWTNKEQEKSIICVLKQKR